MLFDVVAESEINFGRHYRSMMRRPLCELMEEYDLMVRLDTYFSKNVPEDVDVSCYDVWLYLADYWMALSYAISARCVDYYRMDTV